MSPLSGLILVTDRLRGNRSLVEICGAALGAGFSAVMLREKDLGGRELLQLAEPLSQLCRRLNKELLINGHLDVALALPEAGAHIGAGGIPVSEARRLLGPGRRLGYSAHAVDEAGEALAAGADYVTLSPIFPSISKPGLKPRGLPFLRDGVKRLAPGTVIALGGIDRDRLSAIRDSGAHGAAVMGALMQAEDPEEQASGLVSEWSRSG